jgi:hypothetical protein
MKKLYIAPAIEDLEYISEEVIAASGVFSEDPEIPFVGVDDDGNLDPAAKLREMLGIPDLPL